MESGGCCGRLPAAVKLFGVSRVFPAAIRSRGLDRLSLSSQGLIDYSRGGHFGGKVKHKHWRTMFVPVASADSSKCGHRSLATPLEPQSSAGRFLSGILKNHPHIFPVAAAEQLEELASERSDAFVRHERSLGSSETCLHERIAEMKEYECQIAIEEVMYMLVVRKFFEIRVPMVPRLSECLEEGKLELWMLKEREMESIHSVDVLELVRAHLSTVLGWRGKSNVTDSWVATPMSRLQLGRIYAASIMYGYFLKSACLRHQLEQNFNLNSQELHGNGIQNPPSGCLLEDQALSVRSVDKTFLPPFVRLGKSSSRNGKLKRYLMGFDSETLQRCAKLKSVEAVNLIEKHSWALFGDGDAPHPSTSEEVISVSHSSLKRLVLEAVAFGSFLWDVERYVDSIYRLKEN